MSLVRQTKTPKTSEQMVLPAAATSLHAILKKIRQIIEADSLFSGFSCLYHKTVVKY